MNSLAYFGRAAAPPPHSYGQYYGFGLLKKRKRARVAKKTHIGYRKVRTVVINGRKRTLHRRVRIDVYRKHFRSIFDVWMNGRQFVVQEISLQSFNTHPGLLPSTERCLSSFFYHMHLKNMF